VAKKNLSGPHFRAAFLFPFGAGLVLGMCAAALFFGAGPGAGNKQLRERADQVNRDLESAYAAQREAQERAGRLAEELARLADYAREIEKRAGRIEGGIGRLADGIDSAFEHSERIVDGLGTAADSIDESRELINELGTIIRGLQNDGGTENRTP
jgi:methyl-accepting chemotaxis protein